MPKKQSLPKFKRNPKHANAFKKKRTPQEQKEFDIQKWTAVARIIKNNGSPTPIKDIVTELYEADQKRKKTLVTK